MIFVVPFVIASVNDVRWRWLAAGVLGSAQSSDVEQVGSLYLFRVDAGEPPDDAEELIVYDVNDVTHFALGQYKNQVIFDKLNIGAPDEPIVIVPGASAPNQITAYTTTRDQFGVVQPNVTLTFQLILEAASRNSSYSTRLFNVVSDGDGSLGVALEKGAKYQVRRGRTGNWKEFTASTTGTTYALPEVIGMP